MTEIGFGTYLPSGCLMWHVLDINLCMRFTISNDTTTVGFGCFVKSTKRVLWTVREYPKNHPPLVYAVLCESLTLTYSTRDIRAYYIQKS